MNIQTFSILAGSTACNATCPYCISKMTPKNGLSSEEPEVNWVNFHKGCRLAQINDITTALITGKGEPTLFPEQITSYLEVLNEYNFPLVELQTNGIKLVDDFYREHLFRWYNLGLSTIALSVVHYKGKYNRKIFGRSYPNLGKLIEFLHEIGFSVRLSCVLLKDYIDDDVKSNMLIDYASDRKVEQLSLRSLNTPNEYKNEKIYNWVKENKLSPKELKKTSRSITLNGNLLMTLPNGAQVYDVRGQNVCLTNGLTEIGKDDNIRQLIFFPDGHLRYDWQYKGAILL